MFVGSKYCIKVSHLQFAYMKGFKPLFMPIVDISYDLFLYLSCDFYHVFVSDVVLFYLGSRYKSFTDYTMFCCHFQMVNICWWFYISKFIELLDTVSFLMSFN